MKNRFKTGFVVLASCVAIGSALAASGDDVPSSLSGGAVEARLIKDLAHFRTKERLSDEQVYRLLAKALYGEPVLAKGGIGLMGYNDSRYIDLGNSRNTVMIHNIAASFSSRSDREIVILQGDKAIGALPYRGDGAITFVDFRPDRR